jgi:hyperosmotically inducible periplasmic protein
MKNFAYLLSALSLSICFSTAHATDAQTEMQTSPDSSMMGTTDNSMNSMDTTNSTNNTSEPMMTTQESAPVAEPAPTPDQSPLHKLGTKVQDAGITTAISAKYAVDPLLGPFSISVSTTDGMVTLSGTVDSKTQYERAMSIASTTKGVTSVDATQLMVTPSQSYGSDSYMTAKVKAALLKAQYFSGGSFNSWNIHVETNNGTVYLTGHVPDEMAKTQAMDVVKGVEGVNQVEADLQVM